MLPKRVQLAGLEFFELQLQLLDLAGHLLTFRAENHPPQLGDDQLEMFDLVIAAEQLFVMGSNGLILSEHLLLLADETLYPISPTSSLTLNQLHLNRPQLVAHRLRKLKALEKSKRVARLQESLASLDQLRGERLHLTEDQTRLLAELRLLLEGFLHELD